MVQTTLHSTSARPRPRLTSSKPPARASRRPPKAQTTTSSTPALPKKRASKLAKENDITADQEAEIREAFDLFSIPDPDAAAPAPDPKGKKPASAAASSAAAEAQVIKTVDVRRCLVALGAWAPGSDPTEIKEVLDPQVMGYVGFEAFFGYAALKLNERAQQDNDDDEDDDDGDDYDNNGAGRFAADEREAMAEQVAEAFGLFTRQDGAGGGGAGGVIRLEHLRRVAKELREDIPDATLRDMIKEANGGSESGVVTMAEFESVMQRAGVFG